MVSRYFRRNFSFLLLLPTERRSNEPKQRIRGAKQRGQNWIIRPGSGIAIAVRIACVTTAR